MGSERGVACSNQYGIEKGKYEKEGTWQDGARKIPGGKVVSEKKQDNSAFGS